MMSMTAELDTTSRWKAFEQMAREDGHSNLARYLAAAERTFAGIDFQGKRVLEIGSGRGLRTVFMALRGAEVVSMEPELAGSNDGVIGLQQRRIAALGLTNVTLLKQDFNLWEPSGREFDVLVSEASINHLFESPHHALYHQPTYDRYCEICRKMHACLKPGGVAIITDASRYSLFALAKPLGIRPPWQKHRVTVNWRIHQNAGVWKRILRDAGFESVRINYSVPYSLRGITRLLNNPVGNFFYRGRFLIAAKAS
jgi:SAM-dependent methyltransferase